RLAGAAPGELEAQQLRQPFLGVVAGKGLAAHLQVAAGFLQEALGQAPLLTLPVEFQGDFRGRAGVAPGLQVIDTARFVALEKGGADGLYQSALAGFVGAGEQGDAVVEGIDLHGLAELAQLFDAKALELHGATSPPRASSKCRVRMASASRAVSPSGPCCFSRSSANTSPTKPSAWRAAISSSVGSSLRSAVSQVRLRWRASATDRAFWRR